jgi:LysR family transcriptional regulator, hydrogen peroxide-inducible genes activator
LRHMVAAGIGITLMPKIASQTRDRIAYIPFATPKPERSVGLVWRGSTVKYPIIHEMVEVLKKISI